MKKVVVLVAFVVIAAVPIIGQSKYKAPRTPWGDPDLQGIWPGTDYVGTPLQRASDFGTRNQLTEEEFRARQLAAQRQTDEDNADFSIDKVSSEQEARGTVGGPVSPPPHWLERGKPTYQASLIVDPPDGKIPLNEAARRRVAEMRQHSDSGLGDSYADRPLADRCLQGFNSGPPMTPGAYNNNVQIVQSPGYVVIINEMVHNARVIPTDGRPHTKLRQWSGDSRGRWDGETLVVDTINFRRETSLQGSTANTTLVERFTRMDADTIKYEFTVTDPTAYTRPWTAMLPLTRIREPIFEYGCHEGNYALPNILAGARKQEQEH